MSFNKYTYNRAYKRETYDKVLFLVPKGKKQIIKNCAENHGVSMAKLIIHALETTYGIDLSSRKN